MSEIPASRLASSVASRSSWISHTTGRCSSMDRRSSDKYVVMRKIKQRLEADAP
ncbi:MAG: hypothetical protein HY246_02265 [Proteobacteria bacterium]|nr:hypothetical protein [Pseudomonadota bacterium]